MKCHWAWLLSVTTISTGLGEERDPVVPPVAGASIKAAEAPSSQAPFYPDKMDLLVWRDAQGQFHRVTAPDDWQRRRRHIVFSADAPVLRARGRLLAGCLISRLGPSSETGASLLSHWTAGNGL